MLRLVATALILLCGAAATATAAVTTGVSDQRSAFFDSPAYRALDLNTVRLVVPWDAAYDPGPWSGWLERAQRDGATIQVALEHSRASRCPGAPCPLPSTGEYGNALSALLAAYPAIREITAWNEPNHNSQPTFQDPAAAAAYYEEARARCPACVVVAGDFLDDGALASYLSAYKAGLSSSPAVWGLHNYFDATYFGSRGVDTMLHQTTGELWLNETGGIVSFGTLGYDEQRAADSIAWVYGLADQRPRMTRMYQYQWQGTPENAFDSGLLGYDGTPRPAYDVVAGRVGPRGGGRNGGAAGTAGAGTPVARSRENASLPGRPAAVVLAPPDGKAALRPGRRLRLFGKGLLEVRARCVARRPGAARCRQRLVVRVAGAVVARLPVDVAVRRSFVKVIRLPRWATRRLTRVKPRRVQLQTCTASGRGCTRRTAVPVSVPRALRGQE